MAASPVLRVRVLGPLEVSLDGVPAGPAGAKRRGLLALLALHADDVVLRDALVDGLWGEAVPPSATNLVQTYVSAWRRALEPARTARAPGGRLERVGGGYRLHLTPDEADVLRFRELVELGRRRRSAGNGEGAVEAEERALALWHGPPLADLADQPFHAAAVQPLLEARTQVLEDWAEAVLPAADGPRLGAVVAALQEARAGQPWDEHLTALLMWALLRQGRQREALALYAATRRTLADELGTDPGPALQAMHRRVLAHDAGLLGGAPTGGPPAARGPAGDPLLGRERELAQLLGLLESHRLVTVTGPGGAGKTRLAAEAAALLRARGTPVVALDLDGAGQVPSGPHGEGTLLVLDTLDRVPGAARDLRRLLHDDPGLRVLATSRGPLGADLGQRLPVEPLPLPRGGERDPRRLLTSPAVRLLVERVRAADPSYALDARAVRVLAAVARALDGLPLALVLAAPWVPPLTAPGLLDRLDRPLDLEARYAAVPRHRSLRASVEWSVEQLGPDEQQLLARIAVLRDAATLPLLEQVAGDADGPVLPLLLALVDAGLVQAAGGGRFRLLRVVRCWAAERLEAAGGREQAERRHAAAYARELRALAGAPDAEQRATAGADDLRAALDRLTATGDETQALELVADAMVLWALCGHEREGAQRLSRVLEAAPAAAPAQPVALAYDAWLRAGYDAPRAAAASRAAVELAHAAGDMAVEALALTVLAAHADDHPAGLAALERAASLARACAAHGLPVRWALTAPADLACAAASAAAQLWAARSVRRALGWQAYAVTLAERTGSPRSVAAESAWLGLLHLSAGDAGAAVAPVRRAAALGASEPVSRWDDVVVEAQARLAHTEGDAARAEALLRRLLRASCAGGRLRHVTVAACDLVDLLCEQGRLGDAEHVLRLAEDLARAAAADLTTLSRLQVRRARLLRRAGRPAQAVAALAAARRGLPGPDLAPERVVWFVEAAQLAQDVHDTTRADRLRAGLAQACERTGVVVPPWERRLLEAAVPARG